jgi:hypothetical protein
MPVNTSEAHPRQGHRFMAKKGGALKFIGVSCPYEVPQSPVPAIGSPTRTLAGQFGKFC